MYENRFRYTPHCLKQYQTGFASNVFDDRDAAADLYLLVVLFGLFVVLVYPEPWDYRVVDANAFGFQLCFLLLTISTVAYFFALAFVGFACFCVSEADDAFFFAFFLCFPLENCSFLLGSACLGFASPIVRF